MTLPSVRGRSCKVYRIYEILKLKRVVVRVSCHPKGSVFNQLGMKLKIQPSY